MASSTSNIEAREIILDSRQHGRQEAFTESSLYRSFQISKNENPLGPWHMIFDFLENFLLLSLLKHPGQLHFITVLKFYIFGISNNHLNCNVIFGLPKGQCPVIKTFNDVASMFHNCIGTHQTIVPLHSSEKRLQLHSDNCDEHNKNRYMLYFLTWRVIMV